MASTRTERAADCAVCRDYLDELRTRDAVRPDPRATVQVAAKPSSDRLHAAWSQRIPLCVSEFLRSKFHVRLVLPNMRSTLI